MADRDDVAPDVGIAAAIQAALMLGDRGVRVLKDADGVAFEAAPHPDVPTATIEYVVRLSPAVTVPKTERMAGEA